MKSMPSINQDRKGELEPIPGSPPDMLGDFAGCPLLPGAKKQEDLRKIIAAWSISDPTHRVRCWLVTEQAKQIKISQMKYLQIMREG